MNPIFPLGLNQVLSGGQKYSKQVTIQSVPEWFKVNALLWSEGIISDSEFVNSIEFLINNKIIRI